MRKLLSVCATISLALGVCAENKPNASVSLHVTSRLPIAPGEGCSGVFHVKNTGDVPFVVVTDDGWSSATTWFYREGNEEQQRIEEVRGFVKQWKERGRAEAASCYYFGIKSNKAAKTLQPNETVTFECKKFYFDAMPSTPSTIYKAEMYIGNNTWVPVEISPPIGFIRNVDLREAGKDNVFVYAQEGTNQFLYLMTDDKFVRVGEMKLDSTPQKEKEENAVTFEALDGTKKKLTREQARQIIDAGEQQNQ